MKRAITISCLLLILASCGFKPLYKVNREILNYKVNVIIKTEQSAIDESLDKDKQVLRHFLKSRLNVPGAKPSSLKLVVEMTRSIYGMGIQKDLTTTRNAINYNVSFKFYDKLGEISSGSISKSSSFNIGESPYQSLRAEETSAKNVLKSIANELSLIISTTPNKRKVVYP